MSEGSLGEAVLDLTANSDSLEKELDKAKKPVESKVGELQKVFSAIMTSAVLTTIVQSYRQVVTAAEEAAVTEAKVAGVIRATGNAAGYTVGQLSEMADGYSRLTGVDDEVILNAEAVLLTFRKVGREVFPEATQAALDMSAVMGQDLQSSIVQIGKALNDPIAGISALSRVGVTFTDDQKTMIQGFVAQNDIMSAQQVILEELQAEFGGTAEAMEKASTGSKRLGTSWGNLQEELGENLVPQQRAWNLLLAETLDLISEGIAKNNEHSDAQQRAIEMYSAQTGQVILSRAQLNMHRDEIERNTQEILKWQQYGQMWEERLAAESAGVETLAGSLQMLDFKSILNTTMTLSSETAKFREQQEGVRAKQAEIKLEIDNLIAQGWSPLSEKVLELQGKYGDLSLQYDNNALKHKAATDKILFDLFMQKISVDGVTDAEYLMALEVGKSTGVIDAESAKQAMAFDKVAQAVADGTLGIEDMKIAIDMLEDKEITITVNEVINRIRAESASAQRWTAMADAWKAGEFAKGTDGWLTVPSGYPNDNYMIGLTSGEQFAVVPNVGSRPMTAPAIAGAAGMGMSGGGGKVVPVQFVYQPFIGVNDEREAVAKLRGIVERINREGSRK